jgi:hypothetical protein
MRLSVQPPVLTGKKKKNYETLKQEIEEVIRRCKDLLLHSWIGRINLVKAVNNITESNLQIQCNPHQNSNDILHKNRKKSILKFIWKQKDPAYPKQY